jgi:hypothetical protein
LIFVNSLPKAVAPNRLLACSIVGTCSPKYGLAICLFWETASPVVEHRVCRDNSYPGLSVPDIATHHSQERTLHRPVNSDPVTYTQSTQQLIIHLRCGASVAMFAFIGQRY